MTACIYHGPPGSYKTFSIIQDVIIPALLQGRSVVTNIRGLDDILRIEDALTIDIPDSSELFCVPHTSEGFDTMAKFFHWAPEGALIVMDECQRVYPSRLRNLSVFDNPDPMIESTDEGRPVTVEDAFDKHRHFNWDIYISTPFIGKLNNEVRQVCEYAYKHRDLSGFLPWWKNRYGQTKHEPLNNGSSASHHIGDPKRSKADVRVFNTYQSTKTGVAKSSNENKSIFKQKKIFFYLGLIALSVGFFVFNTSKIVSRGDISAPEVVLEKNGSDASFSTDSHPVLDAHKISSDQFNNIAASQLFSLQGYYKGSIYRKIEEGSDKEPFIHLFSFVDSSSERRFEVSSRDLIALGIDMYVSDCLAYLSFANQVKLVTCLNPSPNEYDVRTVERSNASEQATRHNRVSFLDDKTERMPSQIGSRERSAKQEEYNSGNYPTSIF